MTKWKEEFDKEFTHEGIWNEKRFSVIRVENYTKESPIIHDDKVIEDLKSFISTQIIEKLIDDVEHWHIKKGGYTEMAHQLRDKWL